MNKTKCPQCRGKYPHSDFYVHNGQRMCRECIIFNMEGIMTEKSLKIANYLRKLIK